MMQIDKTTLNDLSIFQQNEEESVFHQFNNTQTNDGKFYLQQILATPLQSIAAIVDTQNTIKHLFELKDKLPTTISNGTLMVIEKFYETAIDNYPTQPNVVSSFSYTLFSKTDYALSKYSLQHFINFIKGIKQIEQLLDENKSKKIMFWKQKIALLINKSTINLLAIENETTNLSSTKILHYCYFLRSQFKQDCYELIEIYCKLDAYLSIANTTNNSQFQFPNFIETQEPIIKANALYHLLLSSPIAYNVELNKEENFLFLTGANMAGKSTFIKAIGVAVYIAHLGLPVPAQNMQLSFFDGLLSNIHIVDNIFKNESYFFNEVQRIKSTVEKINDNKKWLILIDELFKGTNIQDAMKCSTTVINGLQKRRNSLFILSTHLYEIGEDLKNHSNIQFKYFETNVINNELEFSYQLKNGISNDKLGYLILEKEGVVELLKK